MEEYNANVGFDVHNDTIAVAVAYPVFIDFLSEHVAASLASMGMAS